MWRASTCWATGGRLRVTIRVADLTRLAQAAAAVPGTQELQYIARWQMGNVIYFAAMETTPGGTPSFFAGRAQSVDLCSVSACNPHVITYPEPGFPNGGRSEPGSVACAPSGGCTITIDVAPADVGSPGATSLLEEVGAYAFASSHQQGALTNAQAQADNVPLEIDGACCYDFRAATVAAKHRPAARHRKPRPHRRRHPRFTG